MTDYRIVNVSERDYLYVTRTTPMAPDEIGRAMGEAFATVMGFMQERGIAPAGPALSVYYSYDPDEVTFRAGFFVTPADARKADGEVSAGKTPAVRVLSLTHVGPYSALRGTYDAMMAHLEAEGLKLGAPTWEVYVDDPDTTPESELRTEIFVALA